MNIQEIQLKSFPVILITDNHTNLSNIKKLKESYPNIPIISLGDFCFLFSKPGEKYNSLSIQYFIDNKIPALEGNHESFLIAAETGDSFTLDRVIGNISDFNLSKEHLKYLQSLPRGFKLVLPDGNNYLCFHNEPRDLWNFNRNITEEEFLKIYPIDNKTRAVLKGHLHENIVLDFPNINCKLITIGQLCGSNHHTGENSGNNYALLTEKGIEFKKI